MSSFTNSKQESSLASEASLFSGGVLTNPEVSVTIDSETTASVPSAAESASNHQSTTERESNFLEIQRLIKEKVATSKDELQSLVEGAGDLDLVIVMDCTGSMSSWIDAAKTTILSIVESLVRENEGSKIRVGFVAYRDYGDGDQRLQAVQLTEDIQTVQTFIRGCTANGGADTPEDVAGGISAALKMDWKGGAKCILLVADAPCHGEKYHSYPGQDDSLAKQMMAQEKVDIEELFQDMSMRGIDFSMIEAEPQSTKKMLSILKEVYLSAPLPSDGMRRKFTSFKLNSGRSTLRTRGCSRFGRRDHMDGSGPGYGDDGLGEIATVFASTVKSSCSASIRSSKSRAFASVSKYSNPSEKEKMGTLLERLNVGRDPSKIINAVVEDDDEEEEDQDDDDSADSSDFGKSPKKKKFLDKVIRTAPLNWDQLANRPKERAIRYTYVRKPDVDIINWNNPMESLRLVSQATDIQILETSFAQGAMRRAHGFYDKNLSNKKFVAKVYLKNPYLESKNKIAKAKAKAAMTGTDITPLLRTKPTTMKDLIEQDNLTQIVAKLLAKEYSIHEEIPTAIDFIFTSYYDLIDREPYDPLRYISVEPYIEGEYKKYNNNNGWIHQDFSETAQAFSHFTWQCTYGRLMVVDLQGVNYILTDPQIHTYNPTPSTSTAAGTSESGSGGGGDTTAKSVNKFGEGNLGLSGMISFFATHTCNHICKKLGLVCFEDTPPPTDPSAEANMKTAAKAVDTTDTAANTADEDEVEVVNDLLAEQFHSKLDVSAVEYDGKEEISGEKSDGVIVKEEGEAAALAVATTAPDKLSEKMEVSCDLCANLMMVKHKTVIKLYQKKQSITCSDCFQQLSNKVTISCKRCTVNTFQYSPYFYRTIGMVPPRFCHTCKKIKNEGYPSKKPTK